MQILVVEDDRKISDFIAKGMREAGFNVTCVADGDDALDLAQSREFDLAIVDLMIPGIDGMSLIRLLRRRKIAIPILILSARQDVEDRVQGLQTGADDYLTKPFAFSELLARVQALIRRGRGVTEPNQLKFADLTIDLLTRKVTRGDSVIELQNKEFQLLVYLMRHPNMVVSKTMIIENVWNYYFDPQTNIVEARISRLRDKIDKPFAHKLIQTVKGVGYVLRED
ncbi:MAG: response regulator transcription factor [Acidobacteria bacterium]|nr:response regulator transcription factor [Acidobacteriota bacterium]MCB9398853.1 response regulator transcription factor [Acidobacteriota bacterium]